MKVNQWKAETTTVLSAIHRDFGTYFEQVFAQAAERYKQRQVTAREPRYQMFQREWVIVRFAYH